MCLRLRLSSDCGRTPDGDDPIPDRGRIGRRRSKMRPNIATERQPLAQTNERRTARVACSADESFRARPPAIVARRPLRASVRGMYCCSTTLGMRPLAGTAIPCCVAQARITLGLRLVVLAERDEVVRLGRRLDCRGPSTGRAAFQYLSSALESETRFFFDRSISRQSPFHPSRTVSAPSDPSRSSTNSSTVTVAIACVSNALSDDIGSDCIVIWPTPTVACRSRCAPCRLRRAHDGRHRTMGTEDAVDVGDTERLMQNPSLLLAIASDGIGPIGITSRTRSAPRTRAISGVRSGHRVARCRRCRRRFERAESSWTLCRIGTCGSGQTHERRTGVRGSRSSAAESTARGAGHYRSRRVAAHAG